MIKLNDEWKRLYADYKAGHQDPRNQACHTIGIPLIVASIPIGATIVGLPLAAGMFTTGWAFQLIGHRFEGNNPAFLSDKRFHVTGVLWWLEKIGVPVE